MKIAMLTNNYKPFIGGVSISVERQAEHLARLGHEVTVFAPDFRENEGIETLKWMEDRDENVAESLKRNLRVICFRSGRKEEHGMVYPRFFMPEISEVFAKETFDCIHVHHPMFVGNAALHLGGKYGIPVIYTYHTNYEDYLHYVKFFENAEATGGLRKHILHFAQKIVVPQYMKWFANRCDMIFAPTRSAEKCIRDRGVKTMIRVLPTGLEDAFYQPDVLQSAELRYQYGNKKKWMFSTVGRLEEEKNLKFLLEGLRILRQPDKLGEDFQMLFFGEGSQLLELQKLAADYGLEEQVAFAGNVSNEVIKHVLYASDLFLFSSKSETQGIVLAESFASGCPVVAVSSSGVDDIVKSGENGFATVEDPEIWAEKVMEALQEENMERLRAGAKKTAEQYRAVQIAKKEEIFYKSCISMTGRRDKCHIPSIPFSAETV